MAKRKYNVGKSNRKQRKAGYEHTGFKYDGSKGLSWNSRGVDAHGNQVGDRNPSERLFGPGESDRPADMSANVTRQYIDSGRGMTPQGTTANVNRSDVGSWYHSSSYGQQGLTGDTNNISWQDYSGPEKKFK